MVETAENTADAGTAGDEGPKNDVQITDVGPARKRLTITVPAERVRESLDQAFASVSNESNIPGFRPGKAPKALIERRFGKSLRAETRGQLIASAYSSALEEHGIRPLGEPALDEADMEGTIDPEQPLTVSLEVEVVPSFDLPVVENLPIRRPVIEVTDEHVAAEIVRNGFRFGTPERITGPFQALDRTLCAATVTKKDHEGVFFQTDQAIVVVPPDEDEGRGQLLGLIVDGVREAMEGKSVGDTVVVETVGPAQHEREDVRGAHLTIELKVIDAERVHPLDEAGLVGRFALDSPESLHEQVRLALETRRDNEQRNAMREQLYEHLLGAVDFPLPAQMTAAQSTRMIERQRIDLLSRGAEADVVERTLAQMRESTEAQSQSRLKLFFILAAFAESLGVQVSEAEVNGLVTAIARQRGERPERLRAELQQSGRLGEVGLQIREHKTADRLLDSCSVKDVDAEEYNREVLARRTASSPATAPAPAKRRRRNTASDGAESTAES